MNTAQSLLADYRYAAQSVQERAMGRAVESRNTVLLKEGKEGPLEFKRHSRQDLSAEKNMEHDAKLSDEVRRNAKNYDPAAAETKKANYLSRNDAAIKVLGSIKKNAVVAKNIAVGAGKQMVKSMIPGSDVYDEAKQVGGGSASVGARVMLQAAKDVVSQGAQVRAMVLDTRITGTKNVICNARGW